MDFYIDSEFIEGFRRPVWWLPSIGFNRKRWFIELISIGIKAADGRKYYAISDEFNKRHANDWVKKNVIAKLPKKYDYTALDSNLQVTWSAIDQPPEQYMLTVNPLYKSLQQITADVLGFTGCKPILIGNQRDILMGWRTEGKPPTFYAYYADYDWVLFCTLFGAMVDLPTGFPMYCIDLKQELDSAAAAITRKEWRDTRMQLLQKDFETQVRDNLEMIKRMPDYPKQGDDEHTADADAEFNHRLHIFIERLRRLNRI